MEKIKKFVKKVIRSPKKIIDRKHYFEFFAAALSIPVLITVFLLNINSLKTVGKAVPTPSPAQTKVEKIYIPVQTNIPQPDNNSGSSVLSGSQCRAEVGPVSIDTPAEGEKISDNPVNVNINYADDSYCSVVWSYRVNNGSWSEYDDKSIALYNVPAGNVKVDLRVKSIVNGKEKDLTRNFIYSGGPNVPTPTPTNALNINDSSSSTNSAS